MAPAMRILICASESPVAPLNGLRLQLRALCEELGGRHEVCVVALRWPGQKGSAPAGVELVEVRAPQPGALHEVRRLRALASRTPLEALAETPPVAAAVTALRSRRDFDVAHVTPGALAGVAPALAGVPALIAPLDAWTVNARALTSTSRGPRKGWRWIQEHAVRRYVAGAYRPYRRVILVSEDDAAETRRLDGRLRTAVVPNGVDTDHYSPASPPQREPGLVVFTGALSAPSNEQAARHLAREVLPALRARVPDARLAVVGRGGGPGVGALAGLDGVELVGEVPDVRPWLRRAAVYACAMTSGTGIKNKLLEALACGAPSVATPLALRGTALSHGRELMVAAPGAPFADALAELLGHPAVAARLGEAGRRHVVERHAWGRVARAYEALYEEIAGGAPSAGRAA